MSNNAFALQLLSPSLKEDCTVVDAAVARNGSLSPLCPLSVPLSVPSSIPICPLPLCFPLSLARALFLPCFSLPRSVPCLSLEDQI